MNDTQLPLFPEDGLDQPLAWHRGQAITAGRFLAHAQAVAEDLPPACRVVNLCADRYLFTVTLVAAALRGQTTLLPPNQAPSVIQAVAEANRDACFISDAPRPEIPLLQHRPEPTPPSTESRDAPCLAGDFEMLRVYTSGSTGRPVPHAKTWRNLVLGAAMADGRFKIGARRAGGIVATVPPQHMYGLETTVMLPLLTGIGIHSGQPFFPEDIRAALDSIPAPRILVTTPIHLKACCQTDIDWPEIDFIISATAPLSTRLAAQAENRMNTRVLEIYGCTEAGSMASRHTTADPLWQWYDDLHGEDGINGTYVLGDHLPKAVVLADTLDIRQDGRFRLLGRHADMLNIAGKRGSLGDLNTRLNEIEGVLDGVFVLPESGDEGVTRLLALVVAPGLSTSDILNALAKQIDPVFLPRPLYRVDRLPRTATGKLPRELIVDMLREKQACA